MSEQLKYKRKRIFRLLKFIKANKKCTRFKMEAWLYTHYTLGEKSRRKDIDDLIKFGYIYLAGGYFKVKEGSLAIFEE